VAISIRGNAGAWAAVNATTQTVTLPTHQAGDMLIVRTVRKPFTNPDDIVVNTTDWNPVATGVANGSTANGNGTGSMAFKAFWKVATSSSETNPEVTWGTTAAPGAACAVVYQKGGSESWVTPTGNGGGDATARTSQTSTIASHISVTAGDMVDFYRGQCDDSGALTVPTITQASVTFGTVAEEPATALLSNTSNDIAADGGYRLASSGTSSAAAVVTGTSAASEQHGAWMTRLRVFTPETHSGSLTATGGGVRTGSGRKGAQVAATATGGGSATTVGRKGAAVGLTSTGAGVSTTSATTDRLSAVVATGGGVASFDGLAEEQDFDLEGTLTATGAGVATLPATSVRRATMTATGGGDAAFAIATARDGSIDATGGGVATLSVLAARYGAALMSGGGVLSTLATTARSGSLAGTGGGSAAFEGTSAENHNGELSATGGGSAQFAARTARRVALAATGAGTFGTTSSSSRLASLIASAGGTMSLTPRGAHNGALTATGGGEAHLLSGDPPVGLPDGVAMGVAIGDANTASVVASDFAASVGIDDSISVEVTLS
jgi:hypothetical protein